MHTVHSTHEMHCVEYFLGGVEGAVILKEEQKTNKIRTDRQQHSAFLAEQKKDGRSRKEKGA